MNMLRDIIKHIFRVFPWVLIFMGLIKIFRGQDTPGDFTLGYLWLLIALVMFLDNKVDELSELVRAQNALLLVVKEGVATQHETVHSLIGSVNLVYRLFIKALKNPPA